MLGGTNAPGHGSCANRPGSTAPEAQVIENQQILLQAFPRGNAVAGPFRAGSAVPRGAVFLEATGK